MKQAPMCTLGVGGRPLLVNLGGLLLSSCLFRRSTLIRGGGIGGRPAVKSGRPLRPSPAAPEGTEWASELFNMAALSLNVRFV